MILEVFLFNCEAYTKNPRKVLLVFHRRCCRRLQVLCLSPRSCGWSWI